MKILVINPLTEYVVGGGEINDGHLGEALKGLGHDVIFVNLLDVNKNSIKNKAISRSEAVMMPYSYGTALKLPWPLGPLARVHFYYKFLKELVKQKSDLISEADLILLTGKPLLTRIKKYSGSTIIVSVRGKNNFTMRYLSTKADGIIYWGGCEEDYDGGYLQKTPYLALNPAVNENAFYAGKCDAKLQEKMRDNDDKRVILLYVGRLDPVHQVSTIIEASNYALQKGNNIVLHIIGDGAEREMLECFARKSMGDRCVFHGAIKNLEIGDYFRSSDVLIINPKHTNHPITLMEALSCNTYVIAPSLGRVKKILNQVPFGSMFRPNEQAALNTELLNVLDEQLYSKKQADNGRKAFDTWHENASKISEWCEGLK